MIEGEKQLIAKARLGDAEAFGALYEHYLVRIYRFIFLKVSGKDEAEDLTHEVFLSAWRNIPTYTEQGFPFSSWLYQIARNRVIDYFRTRKSEVNLEEVSETYAGESADTDSAIDTAMDAAKVHSAIGCLPEEQQTLLILRYVEDLPPKEIASILDKREGAVRVMQHRAILRLKSELKKSREDGLV